MTQPTGQQADCITIVGHLYTLYIIYIIIKLSLECYLDLWLNVLFKLDFILCSNQCSTDFVIFLYITCKGFDMTEYL